MYPWKQQTIDTSRGPVGTYRNLRKPLDVPPKGMEWQYDESHVDKWVLKRIGDNSTAGDQLASAQTLPDAPKTLDSKDKNNQNDNEPFQLVEGVDYLKHTVLHDVDTFQGLCLKYRINAIQLRQANGGFSGTNLRMAPPVLYIPLKGHPERLNIRAQDKTSLEYKMQSLLVEFPRLRQPEAKAYLELADGDLEAARKEAKEDLEWEEQQQQQRKARAQAKQPSKPKQETIHAHVAVPLAKTAPPTIKEMEMKPLLQYS